MNKPVLILLCIVVLFAVAFPVHAQELSSGTAIGVPLKEKVQDGDIISSTPTGYKRTNTAYDSQIFGVVSLQPAVYVTNTSEKDTPIVSLGEVRVRVSTINGPIKSGDFVTSSTIPGAAQKATDNGFVLGQAEQDYTSNNPQSIGRIRVILHPHYAQINNDITRNLFNSISLGFVAATTTPLGVIRYFVAGLITLLSFFFGFRFFARASNRGVEAIGRNPLAKQAILMSVFINTIITICIMLFGVAISYLILVL